MVLPGHVRSGKSTRGYGLYFFILSLNIFYSLLFHLKKKATAQKRTMACGYILTLFRQDNSSPCATVPMGSPDSIREVWLEIRIDITNLIFINKVLFSSIVLRMIGLSSLK
jgi:hypothetical protein